MGWVTDWWTHCVCDSAWLKRTISKAINLNIVISAIRPEKITMFCYRFFFKKSELINKWSLEAEPETRWFSRWVVRMAKYRYFLFFTNMDGLVLLFLKGGGVYEFRSRNEMCGMTHATESFTRSPSRFRRNGFLKVIDWHTPCD